VATYRQPFAAIAAHRFWRQQIADGRGLLIVVDSTEKPTEATQYYNEIVDPRVLYFHMPYRPGRACDSALDVTNYPRAYGWMLGNKYHAAYMDTIPDGATLAERYISTEDVRCAIVQDQTLYQSIVGTDQQSVSSSEWAQAVKVFSNRQGFQNRPHLGSKRNFIAAVALEKGAQAIVNYDDDSIRRSYVLLQIDGLKEAHMTGRAKFLTLAYTPYMVAERQAPIWAITDVESAKGYLLDYQGKRINEPVTPQSPMAWTHARRIGPEFPRVPDVLMREGRTTLRRYQEAGFTLNIRREFSADCVRLICGSGSSKNCITEEVAWDDLFPNLCREKIMQFVSSLHKGNMLHT
jgi:hypothetical protein